MNEYRTQRNKLETRNATYAATILQSAVQDVNRLTAERDLLAKTNRELITMARDDAKRIQDLECRARGRQLWLRDDWGRHNLTQDYVSQRTEARLGVGPWCGT